MYLGIVGRIASGKGEVVKILTDQYGFRSFNLSSILHANFKKKGITDFTREDLQDEGDRLRREEGEGVLAKRAIKELRIKNKELGMIVEGIRNPAEVNYLRTLPNFFLIAVKAKQSVRFKRLKKRGKPWDPKTWDEFLVIDRRDKGLGQKKYGQQVGKCINLADVTIHNDTDISTLEKRVKLLIHSITA